MPWTTTISEGTLEVVFAEGMRDPEWTQLLQAIVEELPLVRRVRILLPGGLEAPGYVQPLDDLIRALTLRGVDVERRDVGPPRSIDPPDQSTT
jgi:hypothetical protein